MVSGTSDLAVTPNQEGDDSLSLVSDPSISIQSSLPRTSAAVSENIAAGDDLSAGMEPSNPIASSRSSEIIEAEADQSPGMESSLQTTSPMRDPAEDKQSSGTGSTSSPKMKVNPFMKDLSPAKYDKEGLQKHFLKLKRKLKDGLKEKAGLAFLDDNDMTKAQEKVQELFNLFEAIQYVISKWRTLLKIPIPKKDPYQPNFRADYLRIGIYSRLFIHALKHATKAADHSDSTKHANKPDHSDSTKHATKLDHSDTTILDNLSEYFEATDFMVFLINKLQEEDIMDPLLARQEAKTSVDKFVYGCVHRYEKETISTVICHVINDEYKEAKELFKTLLEHMKPSDITNRGRVYNYALQKAQELLQVRTFLSSPRLSQRYKDVVQRNDRLKVRPKDYGTEVSKVQKFLVDLYLKDDDLKSKIDWEFFEKNDYPYLIQCVWKHHNFGIENFDLVKDYQWKPLHLNYVFTSSAAITSGGKEIMVCLLKAWPTIVNAPYKGVAALHVAAREGNEEAIKRLLEQEELDMNVRTGLLLTIDEVKEYQECGKLSKGIPKSKGGPPAHATSVKDREELIHVHLQLQGIEVKSVPPVVDLAKKKFMQSIGVKPIDISLDIAKWFIHRISKKKWNENRWKLPTYQTALHIATSQGHAEAVKLLCEPPKQSRHLRQKLLCHLEDEEERTPVDILYDRLERLDSSKKDPESARIERILLRTVDVRDGKERLYRHRQVLVDAVNTILVVAALIAGVTYAGWLQPPLGYAQYYDLPVPYPAPPDTYDSYLPVRGNLGVKVFALFNSLSFFFAIATVIVGADASFPTQTYEYIGRGVQRMRFLLRRAIMFLMISLVCVLGAFSSAAIVVLPPHLFFRKDLVFTIIVGGGLCSYLLWQSLSRQFTRVQRFNVFIRDLIKSTNVF